MNFSNNKSRRVSKTIAEMTIGIIGILAVMLAQISAKPVQQPHSGQHSTTQPVKLVSVINDDTSKSTAPVTNNINWINLLF